MKVTINLEQISIVGIIGILPYEREHKQRILIDIVCEYEADKKSFIDYASILNLTTQRVLEQKYFLLEEAIDDLKNYLNSIFCFIDLKIRITKPDIFENCTVSIQG